MSRTLSCRNYISFKKSLEKSRVLSGRLSYGLLNLYISLQFFPSEMEFYTQF